MKINLHKDLTFVTYFDRYGTLPGHDNLKHVIAMTFIGGESKGDSDATLCCWFEHIAADTVWD